MRRFIQAFGQRAAHSMGQHFLIDPDATAQTLEACPPLAGRTVLEIGPGPGALTAALLDAGARVIAVEKDARVVEYLRERFPELAPAARERLTVLQADATRVELVEVVAGHAAPPFVAVGNLPYNVGTRILTELLPHAQRFERMVFMFQREVALRLTASPGSRDFGSLTLAVADRCEARIVHDLPPESFEPPPRVHSCIVRFDPRAEPRVPPALRARFEAVVRAAFAQRRKTLHNALRALTGADDAPLRAAGIDPGARAETLDLDDFVRLTRALYPEAEPG